MQAWFLGSIDSFFAESFFSKLGFLRNINTCDVQIHINMVSMIARLLQKQIVEKLKPGFVVGLYKLIQICNLDAKFMDFKSNFSKVRITNPDSRVLLPKPPSSNSQRNSKKSKK